MFLEKIHSGTNLNRSVNITEILGQYLFGGSYPNKFVPNKFYNAGQFVYVVNKDGTVSVYQCSNSGTYEKLDLINWNLATLDCSINTIVSSLTGVSNNNSDLNVQFNHDVLVARDLTISGKKVMLPDSVTEYTELTIFIDGKYISKDLGDYELTYNERVKCIDIDRAFDDIIIYTTTPLNHNAKLIAHTDVVPSHTVNENNKIITYVPIEVTMNGYSVNVYIDGIFISPTVYNQEFDNNTGNLVITFPEAVVTDTTKIVISITSSRSKNIKIEPYVISPSVSNEVEGYRINVQDACDYYKDTPIVFKDGKGIPFNVISIDDDVVSVTDTQYYGQVGDYFDIISYDYKYEDLDTSLLSASIMLDVNERHIPIPITDYTKNVDFLVFYKSGSYISKKRFYTKDGYIHLYNHEPSLLIGDIINFEGLDDDSSVSVRSYIGEIGVDRSVYIPSDVTKYAHIVFTDSGVYIGKNFYNVEDNILTFTDDARVSIGDTIEVVYFSYHQVFTNTVCKLTTVKLSAACELLVPLTNFDISKDKIIIFNSDTGIYIDPSRYTVQPSGIIKITSGSGIQEYEEVDVMVIRSLDKAIYTSSVDYVLDII